MLAPFLSLCQDECPLITAAFIALQHDVRAAGLAHRVVFVEATVDPGRDTRGPPRRLPEGVRGRLGPLDRHAGPHRRLLEAVRRRATRSCPRSSRPRPTGAPASRSPTTSTTPTATSSSTPPGASASSTPAAPNEKGALEPEAARAPRRRRPARPAAPAGAQLDDGRRPGLHQLAARHQRPGVGLVMGGRLRRTALVVPAALAGLALVLSRLRRRRRDDAVVAADHRHLADADAAALAGRARSWPPAAATRSTTSSPTPRRTAPASTTAACSSGRRSS